MSTQTTLLPALFLFLLACGRSPEATPVQTKNDPVHTPAHTVKKAEQEKTKTQSGMSKIVPQKRVPIVGGCSLKCSNAQASVQNFLFALLHTAEGKFSREHEPSQNPMLFIDSQGLLVNKQSLASNWHTLWMEGRFKERTDEVHRWLQSFRSPLNEVRQNTDAETLIREGFTVNAQNAYAYVFMAPGLNAPWQFQVKKRGVEWLISEITHAP